jgi:hypothetical protein
MCSTIVVSERAPRTSLPNLPSVPARESEPISRMFVEPLSLGGRLPSIWAVMASWLMPS